MGLGFEREDGVDVLGLELGGDVGSLGSELHGDGSLDESDIVLIGGDEVAGVGLRRFADELEERELFGLAVDDEGAVENLVAAVFGVDLRESEDLGVGERASESLAEAFEVCDFRVGESETLFLVVCLEVGDVDYRVGLFVYCEDGLVEPLVEVLEHGVELGVLIVDREELLDARDAFETHVLRDFHSVGAPRSDCLTAGADEEAR